MLQRKPLREWTGRDLEKWRARLGELVVLAYKAKNTSQARRIIEDYKKGKITYGEAEKRLRKLAAKA